MILKKSLVSKGIKMEVGTFMTYYAKSSGREEQMVTVLCHLMFPCKKSKNMITMLYSLTLNSVHKYTVPKTLGCITPDISLVIINQDLKKIQK